MSDCHTVRPSSPAKGPSSPAAGGRVLRPMGPSSPVDWAEFSGGRVLRGAELSGADFSAGPTSPDTPVITSTIYMHVHVHVVITYECHELNGNSINLCLGGEKSPWRVHTSGRVRVRESARCCHRSDRCRGHWGHVCATPRRCRGLHRASSTGHHDSWSCTGTYIKVWGTLVSLLAHIQVGQVTKLWLSCYLVLLSIDSKTR